MRAQWYRGGGEFLALMHPDELGLGNDASVTIGKAKVQSRSGRIVEFIGGQIVPHLIATIISEPQFVSLWVPVEAYRVANARSEHF